MIKDILQDFWIPHESFCGFGTMKIKDVLQNFWNPHELVAQILKNRIVNWWGVKSDCLRVS